MKFHINVKEFVKELGPVINIATKNINEEYIDSGLICLWAKSDKVIATAHGGTAAIEVPIYENKYYNMQYLCMEEGSVAVRALNFIDSLESFPPTENVVLSICGNDLKIFDALNEDEYNLIPIAKRDIKLPATAKEFQKSLSVNREIFIKGLKKVAFAMGYAETQSYYMCLQFKASKSGVRFIAGTGARFAIADFKGNNITDASSPISILFPRYNIPNIIKILSKSLSESIIVKEAEKAPRTAAQTVIEFDETRLTILGLDASIDYPDINKILKFDYPYKVSSELDAWKNAVKGIMSTNTKEHKRERDIHPVKITADPVRGHFTLEAETNIKAVRIVPFTPNTLVINVNTGQDNRPWFRCASAFIEEMVSKAGKAKEIVIEFEGRSMASGNEKIKIRPVVARYPEIINDSGVKEKFCMFFACSKI